jgi:hypothetical protein
MVIAYLLIVLKEDAESQYSVDRNAEVVRYWKGIFESGNLPRQDAG